ncbi:MAG TPA: uroporphyrinogen decarboxylase family protein, partial [Vampirovibrionales bacterium]
LTQEDYVSFVQPYQKKILQALPKETPKTLFVKGVSPYLKHVAHLGADILSVDWKVTLSEAWSQISQIEGNTIKCLQGNLDPIKLTSSPEFVTQETKKVLADAKNLPCAHILNLGHGVTPDARVDSVKAFIAAAR